MVNGKTKSGFKFEVSKRVTNDWRFIVALADMDSNDEFRAIAGCVAVIRLLLGDQEQAFYKHLQENDGTVPTEKVWAEITEIIQEMGKPVKKS